MPLTKLPGALAWFTDSLLPDIAYPFLAKAFQTSFYNNGFQHKSEDRMDIDAPSSNSEYELGLSLRIVDAFVVKVIEWLIPVIFEVYIILSIS